MDKHEASGNIMFIQFEICKLNQLLEFFKAIRNLDDSEDPTFPYDPNSF